MEIEHAKAIVAETGKMLLDQGLVARTWGNVSCRVDKDTFAITPSGLDYVGMKADDIAVVDIHTMKWTGPRKPSGEKGVHRVSYEVFDDVNFVIHTHQTYATAIGLAGFHNLEITDEEQDELGGIALADYGLPGTKKLTQNVFKALLTGAKVVLMAHHGALICGKDREETFKKAILLEEICKRNTLCARAPGVNRISGKRLRNQVRTTYHYSDVLDNSVLLQVAANGDFHAQLDDMAQMLGPCVKSVSESKAMEILEKQDAVLVKGIGAAIKASNEDDEKAIEILIRKAAICSLHVKAWNEKEEHNKNQVKAANISGFEARLMRLVYKLKYSKKK